MRKKTGILVKQLNLILAILLAAASVAKSADRVPHGTLETINDYLVVSVWGTPEEMGTAYGQLLGDKIRRVIKDMITDDMARDKRAYHNIMKASAVMERFQPEEYLTELKAIARAGDVKYRDLLLLQYFGDVRRCIRGAGRAGLCTSFAILPPWTAQDKCIVGRNFDYFDNGVSEYAAILAYYRPAGKIPFVTVTWAGVINGWTVLNDKGIVASNDTVYAGKNSLRGISTCNLLRYVAENCDSLKSALELVRKAPKACSTAMLVASGRPPDAAIIEFDHDGMKIRRPENGFVGAANSYMILHRKRPVTTYYGRVGTVWRKVQACGKKKIDVHCNIAGAEGIPLRGMNLHSAMIDATDLRFRLAMGRIPAYRLPYREFRLTEKGLVGIAAGPIAPERRKQENTP